MDYEAARRRMVDNQLRTSNVTDRRLLAAMGEIPRELFVPRGRAPLAYSDAEHVLATGRSLASPASFAKLVQLAEVDEADMILDVGAGNGYSTAVLARLGAQVTGVEADAALVHQANANLSAIDCRNASVVAGALDGAGLPANSYDVIVLEGAVASPPDGLFPLLREGGRLVALVRGNGAGVANVFVKSGGAIATRPDFSGWLPPLDHVAAGESFAF